MSVEKLSNFTVGEEPIPVSFVETMAVKEGVECDVYSFVGESSKDLAVVRVSKGHKTPLQRIVAGTKTVEGHLSGAGTLTVTPASGEAKIYKFKTGDEGQEVVVSVGEVMQWHAAGESDLEFYEICEPPYEDGRFENLPE